MRQFQLEVHPNIQCMTVHTDADLRTIFPTGYSHWERNKPTDEQLQKYVARLNEIQGVEKLSRIERYRIHFDVGRLANKAAITEETAFLFDSWIGQPAVPVANSDSIEAVVAINDYDGEE